MKHPTTFASLFALVLLSASTAMAKDFPVDDGAECGEYGTSVVFADSVVDAARRALTEEKLVFVLHVSGLFEEPDFT